MPPTLMSSAHDISTCLVDRPVQSLESTAQRELCIHTLDVHATVQSGPEWNASSLVERCLLSVSTDKCMVGQQVSINRHRTWCLQRFTTSVYRLHYRRHRPLCSDAGSLPLDLQYNTQVQIALSSVTAWNFNIFSLDLLTFGRPLLYLCLHLFQQHDLIRHFDLDVVKLMNFFSLIEDGYHCSNPYHNAVHAADVTQAMNCFLNEPKMSRCLTPLERLASLLAAVSHDVDHPGLNQAFLVATSNPLVALYQSTSVLENHHWRSLVCLLHTSHVFDHFTSVSWSTLKWQTRTQILATDITRQQDILHKFKNCLDKESLDIDNIETDRNFALQISLKCADISNPCRPWELSRRWTEMVCQEFYLQGDDERKLHLPISKGCDRYTDTVVNVQYGFVTSVVQPLFTQWQRLMASSLSSLLLENLLTNQKRWRSIGMEDTPSLKAADSSDDSTPSAGNAKPSFSESNDVPMFGNESGDQMLGDCTDVGHLAVSSQSDSLRRASFPCFTTAGSDAPGIPRRSSVPVVIGNQGTCRKVAFLSSLVEDTSVRAMSGEGVSSSGDLAQMDVDDDAEVINDSRFQGNCWAYRRGSAPATCSELLSVTKSSELPSANKGSPLSSVLVTRHTSIVSPLDRAVLCVVADKKSGTNTHTAFWSGNRRSNSAHTILLRPHLVIARRCSSPTINCRGHKAQWLDTVCDVQRFNQQMADSGKPMRLLLDSELPILCHT